MRNYIGFSRMVTFIKDVFIEDLKNKKIKNIFVEAEDKLCNMYIKIGCKKINFDYKIPSYIDKNKSIDMNLLIYDLNDDIEYLSSDFLKKIILTIFLYNYDLDYNDERIWNQIDRIKKDKILTTKK